MVLLVGVGNIVLNTGERIMKLNLWNFRKGVISE